MNDYLYNITWKLIIQYTTMHSCVIVHYGHGFYRKCHWFVFELFCSFIKGTSILKTSTHCVSKGEVMKKHQGGHSLCADRRATNQELVAGVLVVFLYVQRLDLGMGDAGTILVNGEGGGTGETCLPGQGWVQRRTSSSVYRGESLRVAVMTQKQASVWCDCEGTYRVFFSHMREY